MSVNSQEVIWETPGVTVSGTTEAQRQAEGSQAPAAELEGALKVIRALSERITERVNLAHLRLQMVERRLLAAYQLETGIDDEMCSGIIQIREGIAEIVGDLQKFQHVDTLYARETSIGAVLDLERSANLSDQE